MSVKRVAILIGICCIMFLSLGGPCGSDSRGPADRVLYDGQFLPQWSPDGTKIVFAHGLTIYTAAADGSSLDVVAGKSRGSDDVNSAPRISPDGLRVTYTHLNQGRLWFSDSYKEIKTANLDGSSKQTLGRKGLKDDPSDWHPTWSPDGSRIAFYSTRNVPEWGSHLYTMAEDGSDVRKVTSQVRTTGGPAAWSPDGQRLAFTGWEGRSYNPGPRYAYTVGIDGGNLTKLGQTYTPPVWSPEGARIAFVGLENDTRTLYTTAPDGSDLRKIADAANFSYLGYSPEYLSWSPDGSKLIHFNGTSWRIINLNQSQGEMRR